MSPQNNHLQRPPAAVLYAVELAKLKQNDNAPCPPAEVSSLWHQQQKNPPFVLKHNLYEY